MKKCAALFLLLLASTVMLAAAEELFTLTKVADGVYAAIAKPQYKTNCNAVVVLLDDSVLVVDTHPKPSAARGLIEQIKGVTNLPVRFVVTTHFHWDHTQGAQSYTNAWPGGVEIISSETTRQNLERLGIHRVKRSIADMPKDVYRLKSELARATDAKEKSTLAENLKQAEAYLAELQAMQLVMPTRTFDRSMILHQKSRTVHLLWLGNAHTDGDVFVYLPKEKFVAGGDALHGWLPFMSDSYPYDWIKTIGEVAKLDVEHLVGGHGGVMSVKGQVELWRNYFTDLMNETAAVYAGGATLSETVSQVVPKLTARYGTRFPDFANRVPGNVEKAYRVVSGSTN